MILERLEENDEISAGQLSEILYEAEEEGVKAFSIEGSLLDYKIRKYAEICNLSLDTVSTFGGLRS